MCCDSWGHKESDMTERLNWTELRKTHRSQPTVVLFPLIYTTKRCKAKSAKGQHTETELQKKTKSKFPRVFSCRVKQMCLISPV